MKYMEQTKKYNPFYLQFFADEGEDEDTDPGDDQDEDDESEDEDPEEKKFSQKDMDAVVKKRLAEEKRKWKKNQKKKQDGSDSKKEEDGSESEDAKARKAAEKRASKAETKVACYEAGVAKDAVEDVVALARAYMEADEDLELDEAIEKVVKKYPHFKSGASHKDEEEGKGKSWGERQRGKTGKMSGVEKAFYDLNPDLKK